MSHTAKENIIQQKRTFNALSALVLFICAVLLITGFRYIFAQQNDLSAEDLHDIEERLQELKAEQDRLKDLNKELLQKENNIWDDLLEEDPHPEVRVQLEYVRRFAGLTDVTGEGVTIELNDKPEYDPLRDNAASIIHDRNIKDVLDLMYNNGAAGAAVNGYRIVNTSNIFCVGTTILCNRERMSPPYRIDVIGPADALKKALDESALMKQLTDPAFGLRIKWEEKDNIVLPAYAPAEGSRTLGDLLQPVEGEM